MWCHIKLEKFSQNGRNFNLAHKILSWGSKCSEFGLCQWRRACIPQSVISNIRVSSWNQGEFCCLSTDGQARDFCFSALVFFSFFGLDELLPGKYCQNCCQEATTDICLLQENAPSPSLLQAQIWDIPSALFVEGHHTKARTKVLQGKVRTSQQSYRSCGMGFVLPSMTLCQQKFSRLCKNMQHINDPDF